MNFFRADEHEDDFHLSHPMYRTRLVDNFHEAFETNLVQDDRSELGLAWVGQTTPGELEELGDFDYNDFDLRRFVVSLKPYGIETLYFGREGSIVAYIPVDHELVAKGIALAALADECDEEKPGLYRLWWD